MKHRILQVINNLETGGAETMLLRLMECLDRDRFDPVIVTMIEPGSLAPRFRELGIEIHALGAKPGRISPGVLMRLRRMVLGLEPDLIQSWLYHSNLAVFLARALQRRSVPLCWNIRHSVDDIQNEPWLTRQVIRAGARFSHRVSAVVFNSQRSFAQHQGLGFSCPRQEVVPNGFDLDSFKPDGFARKHVLMRLGLDDSVHLVGLAGRQHPMKNHHGLAEICSDLVSNDLDIHLLFAGRGCDSGGALDPLCGLPGMSDRIHLMGEQRPLAPFLNSLDCLVVPSLWGEAFPNVLAEAMACGIPCVTNDVGDASEILGDQSRVCPPGDSEALSAALRRVLLMSSEDRASLGRDGRTRISERYELRSITHRYERLWEELIDDSN
jgi:glycosyltransferase involved in cell wall biosynthesis